MKCFYLFQLQKCLFLIENDGNSILWKIFECFSQDWLRQVYEHAGLFKLNSFEIPEQVIEDTFSNKFKWENFLKTCSWLLLCLYWPKEDRGTINYIFTKYLIVISTDWNSMYYSWDMKWGKITKLLYGC